MSRSRRPLILLAASIVLAAIGLSPAAAVGFSATTTVVDASCRAEWVWGDAARGRAGMSRGFVSFDGGTCGTGRTIWWFAGRADRWRRGTTPYSGVVMAAAADGDAAVVLFANGEGTFLGRRQANGQFSDPRRLSRHGLTGAVIPSGDVIAMGGRFWAVWSEQVGPGGEFAQTELFQSQNIGQGHYFDGVMTRTRITFSRRGDDFPTLVAEPSGATAPTFALAWSRNDGAVGEHSAIWLARATADGEWTKAPFAKQGYNTTPDLYSSRTATWLTWTRDGTPAVASRSASGWGTGKTFPHHDGMRPRVAAAGGVFVGWTSLRDVHLAERSNGSWSVANATRASREERVLLALTSYKGAATLVFAAPRTGRLMVRTAN